MGNSKHFFYFGFLAADSDIDQLFAGESHPQMSALRFQRMLLEGLIANGVMISAVSTPPIAPFPRNKIWWISGKEFEVGNLGVQAKQVSGLNLPLLRLAVRCIQMLRGGLSLKRVPCDGIFVYSIHTPMMIAGLLLKVIRGVPAYVFIPDLPMFMGGGGAVKRFLKQVDNRLAQRIVRRFDGAFPITENIGRDWLAKGPRYRSVEGASNEAAAVLASARQTGAFLYRGSARPRLLYTGALSQLLAFATAFHNTQIEASLTFVGGGEDAAALDRLAKMDDRITVKGFMTGEAFESEVALADFLVNARDPSWPGAKYSFPSKLFEYLRSGKPIISTRLPGIPPHFFEFFRPVEMGDQDAFEASLRQALQPDRDSSQTWLLAEKLAVVVSCAAVGEKILSSVKEWSEEAAVGDR